MRQNHQAQLRNFQTHDFHAPDLHARKYKQMDHEKLMHLSPNLSKMR